MGMAKGCAGSSRQRVVVDADVSAVAAFMQSSISAARLVSVASALAALAPLLCGRFGQEPIEPIVLRDGSVSERDEPQQQPAAIVPAPVCRADAHDDLAAAAGAPRLMPPPNHK